jgi:hypothetical protein
MGPGRQLVPLVERLETLRREHLALGAENAALQAENAVRRERVQEPEAQLEQTSAGSSRPPLVAPPHLPRSTDGATGTQAHYWARVGRVELTLREAHMARTAQGDTLRWWLALLFAVATLLFAGPADAAAPAIQQTRNGLDQPEAARRWMVAYLCGVRYFTDGFFRGDAAAREAAIQVLIKWTSIRDRALYDLISVVGLDPDGEVRVASMQADQEMFLELGQQDRAIDLTTAVDLQDVRYARQVLGPY